MEKTIWETSHHFSYNVPGEVTATALATSLLGLEGVFESSAKVLAELLELNVRNTEIILTSIELGSYKDNFIFRIFLGSGEDAEEKVEALRKLLHIDNMTPKALIAIAATGTILYVAHLFAPSKDPAVTIQIENSFNNIGKELGLSREEVAGVFESALKGDENLKKSVVQLLRPDPSTTATGSVVIDHREELTIPEEIVNLVPSKYVKPNDKESRKVFENKQIVVRALDLDKPAQGWWGIIPNISDKRVSVKLGEEVDPATIPVGKYFQADVEVIYKISKKGGKTPKKVILIRKRD